MELVLGNILITEEVNAIGSAGVPLLCLSWYSWKQGTIHKFVWHSGQWYFVFLLNILPCASTVFQQKLQPNAGPDLTTGQWLDLGEPVYKISFVITSIINYLKENSYYLRWWSRSF